MTGTIRDISAALNGKILTVRTKIEFESGSFIELQLPRRELAALLPRSLLTNGDGGFPHELPGIARAVLKTFLIGRRVTIRKRKGKVFFTFLFWDTQSGQCSEPRIHENTESD